VSGSYTLSCILARNFVIINLEKKKKKK